MTCGRSYAPLSRSAVGASGAVRSTVMTRDSGTPSMTAVTVKSPSARPAAGIVLDQPPAGLTGASTPLTATVAPAGAKPLTVTAVGAAFTTAGVTDVMPALGAGLHGEPVPS